MPLSLSQVDCSAYKMPRLFVIFDVFAVCGGLLPSPRTLCHGSIRCCVDREHVGHQRLANLWAFGREHPGIGQVHSLYTTSGASRDSWRLLNERNEYVIWEHLGCRYIKKQSIPILHANHRGSRLQWNGETACHLLLENLHRLAMISGYKIQMRLP